MFNNLEHSITCGKHKITEHDKLKKDLTAEEKLSAKRFFLVPVFAYLIIEIFNQNFLLIVLFLIGYVIYKKFEKGGIKKN